jgi:hypothetical protein
MSYRLLNQRAIDTGDINLIFTGEQVDRMSNTMLRRLAAAANSDEINGKSVQLQIKYYLACQHSLTEYAEG